MRILVPTVDYPPIEGGISTVTVHVARELAAQGHEVTVAAPYFPGMDASDRAEPVRVVRFHGYGWGWLRYLPMSRTVSRLARDTDLILAINIAYGGLMARRIKRRHGTPYIAFAYAYEFLKFERTPFLGEMLRAAYRDSNATVAISRFTRERLEAFGVPADRIATILPGAQLPSPIPQGHLERVRQRYVLEGRRIILSVGRLIERKNHVALVRALPQIRERIQDASLLIVGRGPCMAELARTANAFGVRNEVLLPGYVPAEDLAALYALCDVFALPAKEVEGGHVEGFGLVCAEAASHGKPVVGGRSGGIADAVVDGVTGLLVDPDDGEALANALIQILGDERFAQRLGDAGLQRVREELNWSAFTMRLLDTLNSNDAPARSDAV